MGWRYGLFLLWLCYLVFAGALLFARGFLLSRSERPERSQCQPYAHIPCGPREAPASGCTTKHRLASLLHDVNASTRACPPVRAKVVLLVVDALRYDFAAPTPSVKGKDNPLYVNRLPVIGKLLEKYPERARLFRFVADPPTTTLQRLKGLTTGSLPTFIDAGSNFATPEINEDNVIDQVLKINLII